MKRRLLLAAALLALGSTLGTGASATTFPSKPIRIVVSAPAGSAPDVIGRLLADQYRQRLGQPVVVENRPGAGGILAVGVVKPAEPDGYTLLLAQAAVVVVTPLTYKEAKFDMTRDFEPVATLASTPMLFVANPGAGPKSWREAISQSKAQPDQMTLANPTRTSIPHLAGELVNLRTGAGLRNISMSSTAQGIQAVVNGDMNMYVDGVAPLVPLVKAGRVRALAVAADRELPGLEGIPLAKDVVPDLSVSGWFALFAPKGTPRPVLEQLNAAAQAAMQAPDVVAKMRELGNYPIGGSLAEARAYVMREKATWADVIQRANIRAE